MDPVALPLGLGGARSELDTVCAERREQAAAALERGDHAEALRLFEADLSDVERVLARARSLNWAQVLVRNAEPDYLGAVSSALAAGEVERAIEVAEDSKARAHMHVCGTSYPGRASSPLLDETGEAIQRRAAELAAEYARAAADDKAAIRRAVDETIDLWAQYTQQAAGARPVWNMAALGKRVTVAEVAALLPPRAVYLSYYVLPGRLLIGAIGAQGLLGHRVVEIAADPRGGDVLDWAAGNAVLMTQARARYRPFDDIQKFLDTKLDFLWPDQFLRRLHSMLVEPVRSLLEGATTVVVSPDGVLRGVPLHALADGDGRMLVDDAALSYVSGTRMFRYAAREVPAGSGAFVAGADAAHGGPARAVAEAATVAGLLGCASSPALRTAVLQESTSADVVHLSCHSDFTSLLSSGQGLALEDGLLTADDIRGQSFQARLVTMSACSTAAADASGLDRAEDMFGLVGAFLQAGVPTVAATLWPLPDRVAEPFARAFYTALLQSSTVAEAVRTAQLEVRASQPHPFYWAPFAVWGNGFATLTPPTD